MRMVAVLESISDCSLGLLRYKHLIIRSLLKDWREYSLDKWRKWIQIAPSMMIMRDREKLGHKHQRILTDTWSEVFNRILPKLRIRGEMFHQVARIHLVQSAEVVDGFELSVPFFSISYFVRNPSSHKLLRIDFEGMCAFKVSKLIKRRIRHRLLLQLLILIFIFFHLCNLL